MTFEQIMYYVIAATPAITSLIGIAAACIKLIKVNKDVESKFEEVRKEVFNTKEYSELKEQLKTAHKENRELRRKLDKLIDRIDKIDRGDTNGEEASE